PAPSAKSAGSIQPVTLFFSAARRRGWTFSGRVGADGAEAGGAGSGGGGGGGGETFVWVCLRAGGRATGLPPLGACPPAPPPLPDPSPPDPPAYAIATGRPVRTDSHSFRHITSASRANWPLSRSGIFPLRTPSTAVPISAAKALIGSPPPGSSGRSLLPSACSTVSGLPSEAWARVARSS